MAISFYPYLKTYIGNSTDSKVGITDEAATIFYLDTKTTSVLHQGTWYDFSSPIINASMSKKTLQPASADGSISTDTSTTDGRFVELPYSVPELTWQYTTTETTPIITNASFPMKTTAGATVRNYCGSIQYQNTSATATLLVIQDGATTIWVGNAPASMTVPVTVIFPTPLRGSINSAMNIKAITTGASIYMNAQGFQAY